MGLATARFLPQVSGMTPSEKAHALRKSLPPDGLFSGKAWRISPETLRISSKLYEQIVELGPRLHAFNKACNLLYRKSVEGAQPSWIHAYLDAGKPHSVIETARNPSFKNDVPLVIRPDFLLMEDGVVATELDSVPGGIGVTAWLQESYKGIGSQGGKASMLTGFFESLRSQAGKGASAHIALVVSEEASEYRPEMRWLSEKPEIASKESSVQVCAPEDLEYKEDGVYLKGRRIDLVYRFFELFDMENIIHSKELVAAARDGKVKVTPPLKPQLEEKLWFALFWFPQLAEFWRRELGERYVRDLRKVIPFTWLLDPAPLPPHAVISRLDIHSWEELASFSQKQRNLILKISGYSERAWGSRGVFLGSDMPADQWAKEVRRALEEFATNPHILQPFMHTTLVEHEWYDFEGENLQTMKGRVRLCPYYFVKNDKPELHGILATICPSDKKLIHGMQDAILTLAESGTLSV